MAGVTIPAALHQKMVRNFQLEYEDEFGALDQVRSYTRDELVDKYARDLRFWRTRIPEILHDKRPNVRQLCAHAIATNAVANMKKLIGERGLESEVRTQMRDVYELAWE